MADAIFSPNGRDVIVKTCSPEDFRVDPRYYGEYAANIIKWLDDTQKGNYNHDAIMQFFAQAPIDDREPNTGDVPCGALCRRYGDLVRIRNLRDELYRLSVLAEQYGAAENKPTLHTTLKRIYSVAETMMSAISELSQYCQQCELATD